MNVTYEATNKGMKVFLDGGFVGEFDDQKEARHAVLARINERLKRDIKYHWPDEWHLVHNGEIKVKYDNEEIALREANRANRLHPDGKPYVVVYNKE